MERLFKLKENKSTVRIEVIAGVTTFLTMSYIIFVQPAILSIPMVEQGPPADYFGAVLVATCIASFISCLLMAFLANYPIGLAPGMGENFYFVFPVCGAAAIGGLGYSWQVALGAVFIAGTAFFILSFFKVRETIMDSIPNGIKLAIAGGIGFLIAFVGLQYAGIIEPGGAIVRLGKLTSPWVMLSIVGLIIIATLMAKRVRGAMLVGIVATAIIGLFVPGGVAQEGGSEMLVRYQGVIGPPPSLAPTLFKLDFMKFLQDPRVWEVVFIFFILEMFDTIGTLIGIGHAAGLLTKEGKLPKAGRAFIADAAATSVGALAGTSSVQSYIESSTGVAEGGRTGLTAAVVGILFLLALFFSPLVKMVGGGYNIAAAGALPIMKYPVIAAPLIIVGSLMMKGLREVDWDDPATAISAFITIIMMPLTLSIAMGIMFGFIAYVVIKLLSGKAHEVHWLLYVLAVVFVLRFAFIPV
jgi:AGZA family xanthine/uracil permease-like MFS transporter